MKKIDEMEKWAKDNGVYEMKSKPFNAAIVPMIAEDVIFLIEEIKKLNEHITSLDGS